MNPQLSHFLWTFGCMAAVVLWIHFMVWLDG